MLLKKSYSWIRITKKEHTLSLKKDIFKENQLFQHICIKFDTKRKPDHNVLHEVKQNSAKILILKKNNIQHSFFSWLIRSIQNKWIW